MADKVETAFEKPCGPCGPCGPLPAWTNWRPSGRATQEARETAQEVPDQRGDDPVRVLMADDPDGLEPGEILVDPDEITCPRCGGLDAYRTIAGDWKCRACEPDGLRKLARLLDWRDACERKRR